MPTIFKSTLLLCAASLFLLAPMRAQQGNTLTIVFAGAPSGSCAPFMVAINTSSGAYYYCNGGTWTALSSAPSGGAVGGASTLTVSGQVVCSDPTGKVKPCDAASTLASSLSVGTTVLDPVTGITTPKVNLVTITAPAAAATLTLANNSTLQTTGAFTMNLTCGAACTPTFPSGTHSLAPLDGPSFTTPALGVATATSLAIGGATIGSNALAVTGTGAFSGALTISTAGTVSDPSLKLVNTGIYEPGSNLFGIETNGSLRGQFSNNGFSHTGYHDLGFFGDVLFTRLASATFKITGATTTVGGSIDVSTDATFKFRNAANNADAAIAAASGVFSTTLQVTGHTTFEGVTSTGATGTAKLVYSTAPTFDSTVNAVTGYQVNGAATSGNVLRGNGTNFVSSALAASDLSDYSTGTWTPADNSGAGLTFSSVTATYTKIGKLVTVQATLTYPSTVSGANASISGLPYTNAGGRPTVPMFTTNGTIGCIGIMAAGSTNFAITNVTSAANVTNVQLTGAFVSFSFSYVTT